VVKLLSAFLPSPTLLFPDVSYKSIIPPALDIETAPDTVKASERVVAPATASVLEAVTAPVRVDAPVTPSVPAMAVLPVEQLQ
jgi:hypothetical protein